MKAEEIILTVLQAKHQQLAAEVALLVEIDKNGPKYIAFGRQGVAAHERPIVVLLQNKDPGQAPNRIIATTSPPDESEIGMAWKYGIDRIILWSGVEGKQIDISNDGGRFGQKALVKSGEYQLWTGLPPAAAPSPFGDAGARDWLSALNRKPAKSLTTAGTRAKDATGKDMYSARVAVRDTLSRGLDLPGDFGGAKADFADMIFMHVAYALVALGWRDSEKGTEGGYNIGSILVNPSKKIIAWGLNLINENKSFHAETLMIQSHLARTRQATLPAGCTMYTSLESCHMCAGFAAEVGNGLRVLYGQKDDQILNNALERKVKDSSQKVTQVNFHPVGEPPRLAKPASGQAVKALETLRNRFKTLDKFTGVTKFLFSDLGKYFYDIERKVPGQMATRVGELQKAPSFPAPPVRVPMHALLDPPLSTPVVRAPLAHLDLAMPSKSPTETERNLYNKKLFGAEMDLATYALGFLDRLLSQGVLKA